MASPFYPAYKLTVYAPRSVDPTETTVMTPVAGAPHSDPFVVTTIQGVTGAKPYLDVPAGRTGTIDPLNKTLSVGSQVFRLLDSRVTAGGSNASRWVSAFLGDASGGNRLLGRKAIALQSMDGGATWEATPFWVGRIRATDLDSKLWMSLTVRDPSKDLDVDVFVGAPHSSVTAGIDPDGYAHLAQVAPLGLLQDYGGFPKTTPLRGKTNAAAGGTRTPFAIDVDRTNGDLKRTLFTQALLDVARATMIKTEKTDTQSPKLFLRAAGTTDPWVEYDVDQLTSITTTSLTRIIARKTTKVGAAAAPAAGTSIDFYITNPTAKPSDRLPLLIDDVDPVQYLRDLAAGYFGKLDANGEPVSAVTIDAASFAALDTGKYVPWRKRVTKVSKLNKEFEEVCRAYHFAYFFEGGALKLVTLRRSATTAPAATLVDADLITKSDDLKWNQSGDDAYTAVEGTFQVEREIRAAELPTPFEPLSQESAYGYQDAPDIASVGIADADSQSVLVPILGPRSGDVTPKTFKIEATGFRVRVGIAQSSAETLNGGPRVDAIHAHLVDYAGEITGPFGLGPAYMDLIVRRASANVAAALQGRFVALNLSALPDPATNQRGGPRLAFVIARTEDKHRIKLRLLDAGANSVALVPTLGAPAATAGTSNIGVDVAVTLNAAGEPARISYAITDTTVAVRPAEDDPRWVTGQLATAAATVSISNLPHAVRVWVRSRTEPTAGKGFKLPSAWAFPGSGTGYADVALLAAPAGVTVSGATAATSLARWTNGESWTDIEVLLVTGAAPGAWTDADVVASLPAGSTVYPIGTLLTNGVQYTIGVRHRDFSGGKSAVAQLTFVAGAAHQLLAPRSPDGFSRPPLGKVIRALLSLPTIYGISVIAREFPSFVEVEEAVETGIGTGVYGAYTSVGAVESVSGDWTTWSGRAPSDRRRRKLRARHIRDNSISSAYTPEIVVSPWLDDPIAPYPPPAVQVLTNAKWTDTATDRTYQLTAGELVNRVLVFVNSVAAPPLTDPWPSSAADPATEPFRVRPTTVLIPDPVTRLVSYTVPKPNAKYQTFVQFEARLDDFSDGGTWRNVIDPVASAQTASLHGTVTNATVDLSAEVQAGAADWPVQVDFFADSPFSGAIASKSISANATLTKLTTGLSALGALTLPQREGRRFYIRMTNVAGEVTWGEPITVDRDSLPYGYVTLNDYRSAPTIKVNYDDDTDEVKIFLPGGKTKTWTGLVGAGTVTYTVGDAPDVGSPESALAIDESRSGYQVDVKGGGQYITIWGGALAGVLHGQTTGPSLTVTAIPGTTTYDVAYSGTGVITYSIDGGAFTTPPASPIVGIARGATADKEYRFKCVQAGQTIMNAVIIPSLQKDAISPDLAVAPGTPTSTTQPFTVTATNPAGGPAPTITVTPYNCSIVIAGLTYATPQVVASGTVVTANRPSTVTDTQAHVKFVAAIAGAGSEELDMEIVSQLNFGPTLDVQANPGATPTADYSLVWSGTGVITWSVDGGAYTTPSASPVPIARHATLDKTYSFKAVKDGQTIVNTVTIPSLKSDSVTPTLVVVAGTPTPTTQPFTVTFGNPRTGGTAPTCVAQVYGTATFQINGTGPVYTAADAQQGFSSGDVITVNRPASTTTTQSHIRFRAAIPGGGSEESKILISPALNLGPTLIVTPTKGETSWSIAYSGTGTLTRDIDGTGYVTPPGSPEVVALGASPQTYTYKAVLDGQTVTAVVNLPKITPFTPSLSVSVACDNYPTNNDVNITWSVSGMITGTTYDVSWNFGNGAAIGAADSQTSPKVINVPGLNPLTTNYRVTVNALLNGQVVATKTKSGPSTPT